MLSDYDMIAYPSDVFQKRACLRKRLGGTVIFHVKLRQKAVILLGPFSMENQDKLHDFFAKFDRSKKRDGFNTLNEIAQKAQKKLEAQLLRQQKKGEKSQQDDDDEWKPIEADLGVETLVPFDFDLDDNVIESLDSLKISQCDQQNKVLGLEEDLTWKAPVQKPQPEVEAKPAEVEQKSKPVGKFVVGGSRPKPPPKALNLDSDFPDIVDAYGGKKNKKKNNGKKSAGPVKQPVPQV
ncbi:hypothetical protein RF11_11782 [Thelohanellus kitauei]|uniref:Uncharacterized protein n=1 Tax=Thelohanellus kitauei TaxID=669202 RepID=A0A0C2MIB0_THEKT|nr:hypothetical protein RF11_11782 [Thelohanellus kitauei]